MTILCKYRLRPGLSLVEVLIGIVIISLLLLGFFTMLTGNVQQLEFTAGQFAAVQVATKVYEDIQEESRIHSTLLEQIDLFPELGGKNPLLDAQSPYFRYAFDRSPPYGIIQQGVDQGISAADGAIYQQLNTFACRPVVRRAGTPDAGGFAAHLARVDLEVTWEEKRGVARTYVLPFLVHSPLGPMLPLGLPGTDAEIEPLIREYLFPDQTGQSLEQAAAEQGCNPGLCRDVGRVGVYLDALAVALATLTQEITALQSEQRRYANPVCAEVVKRQLQICRKSEEAASLIFLFVNELAPIVQRLADTDPTQFEALPTSRVGAALWHYQVQVPRLVTWLRNACGSLEWLSAPIFQPLLSFRDRDWIALKRLEAQRLRRSLKMIADAEFIAFLREEKDAVRDRNPFLERAYARDELLMGQPDRFKPAFPNLAYMAERLEQLIKPAASAAARLEEQLTVPSPDEP